MRRAKWSFGDQACASRQSGDGMNLGQLQRGFKFERGQNGRQAFGEHRLAGAGRADEQDVVNGKTTSGGYLSKSIPSRESSILGRHPSNRQSRPLPYILMVSASNASRFSANVN